MGLDWKAGLYHSRRHGALDIQEVKVKQDSVLQAWRALSSCMFGGSPEQNLTKALIKAARGGGQLQGWWFTLDWVSIRFLRGETSSEAESAGLICSGPNRISSSLTSLFLPFWLVKGVAFISAPCDVIAVTASGINPLWKEQLGMVAWCFLDSTT